jgi:hypothetical protein
MAGEIYYNKHYELRPLGRSCIVVISLVYALRTYDYYNNNIFIVLAFMMIIKIEQNYLLLLSIIYDYLLLIAYLLS